MLFYSPLFCISWCTLCISLLCSLGDTLVSELLKVRYQLLCPELRSDTSVIFGLPLWTYRYCAIGMVGCWKPGTLLMSLEECIDFVELIFNAICLYPKVVELQPSCELEVYKI